MANISSNWQNSLDRSLVDRLTRPLRQPGMMKMSMGWRIVNRYDRFLNRFPLLSQQMQRWGNINSRSPDTIPIVYARPEFANEREIGTREDNLQANVSQNLPSVPVIQRKADPSQSLSVQTSDRRPVFENSDEPPSSVSADTLSEPTVPSSSETPVVSSESIAEEFGNNNEESRVGEVSNISQPTVPIIQAQPNHNSPSLSSLPIVNPDHRVLPVETSDRRLPFDNSADLSRSHMSNETNSSFSADTPSEQTFPSSSETPVVSSPAIAEELGNHEEVPLVQEAIGISHPTTPIIQAQQNNNWRSPSSVPVVNPEHRVLAVETSDRRPVFENSDEPPSSVSADTPSEPNLPSSSETPVVSSESIAEEFGNHNEESRVRKVPRISHPTVPIIQAQLNNNWRSPSSVPVVNPDHRGNWREEARVFTRNLPGDRPQSSQIPNLKINQTQSHENIDSLPIISAASPINSPVKFQSLPLYPAKNSASGTHQQSNRSNPNLRELNTNVSSSPRIFAPPSPPTETFIAPNADRSPPKVDVDAIASQVERKLMRRLVIESERRGKNRWH
ncbi:MAG: hypothetical protein AB4290_06915 [Spirulina sp.]